MQLYSLMFCNYVTCKVLVITLCLAQECFNFVLLIFVEHCLKQQKFFSQEARIIHYSPAYSPAHHTFGTVHEKWIISACVYCYEKNNIPHRFQEIIRGDVNIPESRIKKSSWETFVTCLLNVCNKSQKAICTVKPL